MSRSTGASPGDRQEQAGISSFNHHSQLAVNRIARNDLWFCDGWDGASQHGLWHSKNGGKKFREARRHRVRHHALPGADQAKARDATFSVYFYGKIAASPDWGIFRSTDAGATWQRHCRFTPPASSTSRPVWPRRGTTSRK